MIREKQITIKRMRIKVDIKIKLNQILRDKIKKRLKSKYISIKRLNINFDIINKYHDIFNFFTAFKKYFLLKIKKILS